MGSHIFFLVLLGVIFHQHIFFHDRHCCLVQVHRDHLRRMFEMVKEHCRYDGRKEENRAAGYSWKYVGRQVPGGNPAIIITDHNDKKSIYWKMTK